MAQDRNPSTPPDRDRANPEAAGRTASALPDDRPPEPLDPLHRDAVLEGLGQMRRGETAPEEAVAALYRRAGL